MFKLLSIALAIVLLSSCAALDDELPSTFQLSVKTQAGFREYLNRYKPVVFYVATDGKAYGYRYCTSNRCQPYDLHAPQANKICQGYTNPNVTCKVYAKGRTIVWED